MMPSPFELGKAIGENVSGAFRNYQDTRALDEILKKKYEMQNPDAMNNILGQIFTQVSPDNREQAINVFKESHKQRLAQQQKNNLINHLVKQGVSPEEANIYADFTTGGQTQLAKDLLESRKRNTPPSNGQVLTEEELLNSFNQEIADILRTQDEGTTPAEREKRKANRYKTGIESYNEAFAKVKSSEDDQRRFKILEDLNTKDTLPKNLGRLNVDKEGNLRLPFAASPEAERWVKVLNEFSQNAKDTYGSRVTNFDLAQYLKRFPTLLNSREGREQIIEQMKIFNEINSIYYKNLKEVYKKAGGVRNIDMDRAQDLADRMSKPKVEELTKKLDEIGNKAVPLPEAPQAEGKIFRNKKTGELMQSVNGQWIPYKEEKNKPPVTFKQETLR